jgi:HK97 family phage major capsid protein
MNSVAIKAMTEDTATVAGWGVVYGGADLEGETFTPETNYMLDLVPQKPVLYDHGYRTVKHFLGRVTKAEPRDEGIWVEAELDRHAEYVAYVLQLVEKGALGWSSGTAHHLARREDGVIKSWPIIEFSLTPTPAEPRTVGVEVIKSLMESDPAFGALLPEVEAATSTADADAVAEMKTPVHEEATEVVMSEEIKAAEAPDYGALLAEIKGLKEMINQPVNKAPAVNTTGLGEDADGVKAFMHYLRTGDEGGVHSLKAYNNTDMNIGTSADGGYAVPTPLFNQIVARRDEMSILPSLGARQIPGKGLTVRVPIDAEDDVLFSSVAEAGTVAQDAPALGYKDFTLVKYGKFITLSWELLRDEDAGLQSFINDWIGRGVAATENAAILTELRASGTAGLTLDAAASVGYTEIPEMVGKLAPEYQAGAKWILAPSTVAYIQGVNSTAQFLFAPAPVAYGGKPSLWGFPVIQTSAASAMAASAKSLIFGDFSFLGYRRATGLNMLRDPYSVATTGQVRLHFWFDFVPGVLQAAAVQYATHPSA